jgi:hypothetical protein
MKHHYRKLTFALMPILFCVMITTSACPDCADTLALADLAIKAFTAPQTINIGQAFNAVTDVINNEEGGQCTTTDIANTTQNLLQVFFKNGSDWQMVGEKGGIPQDAIDPGSLLSLLQSLTINQAGDYRFDYYDDDALLVDERDENNNYGYLYGRNIDKHTQIRETNNYKSIQVTALPLPDGSTKIEGRPQVEFK